MQKGHKVRYIKKVGGKNEVGEHLLAHLFCLLSSDLLASCFLLLFACPATSIFASLFIH
jgi:hypothetical protein